MFKYNVKGDFIADKCSQYNYKNIISHILTCVSTYVHVYVDMKTDLCRHYLNFKL